MMDNPASSSGFKFDLAYALSTALEAVTAKFFDVTGRTSRRAFWHVILVWVVVMAALSVLSAIPLLGLIFMLSYFLLALALALPMAGLIVRRMHDVGQPWFMGFIPLYNIYLALQPGEVEDNRFGPVPQD